MSTARLNDSLFLSDLHLQPGEPATWAHARLVLHEAARQGLNLYILGDLFEQWVGDDAMEEFDREVADTLLQCSRQVAVFLQHGNRDFLLGEVFCQASGAHLLDDPYRVDSDAGPTLLSHGDAWCTDDAAYQTVRRQVRDPAWQQAMLSQPVEARRALARQAREQSKNHQYQLEETLLDVNPQAVEQAFVQHDVIHIIHGHTHRPNVHRHPAANQNRTRWVLGDWRPQARILLYRQGRFQPLDSHEFLSD